MKTPSLFVRLTVAFVIVQISSLSSAQVINQTLNPQQPSHSIATCGSHHLMQNLEQHSQGFMDLSSELMANLVEIVEARNLQKSYQERYVIPVVFHVVHNDPTENLDDSVILNQLEVLNACFRRQNADTVNLRPEFYNLVGDAQIEFQLATIDPFGNPTSGITRTQTSVQHFGGILPYGQGQNQEISQWVNDSLYTKMFRITQSSQGGHDPWDPQNYLNIWTGDLRVFEPLFNNFEELIYLGLATPPQNHINWPSAILQQLAPFNQGVILHYVNVGSNNPNSFPAPYGVYNSLVRTGEILVHEVGHYLALRHIWGDGDCTADDYISDTPNSDASSNFGCVVGPNSCVDNINGMDLPNMIENYMDYSSGDCQNSFTIGQTDLMRAALEIYRPDLAEQITVVNIQENDPFVEASVHPNPSSGEFSIHLNKHCSEVKVEVMNSLGELVYDHLLENTHQLELKLSVPPGVYLVRLTSGQNFGQPIKLMIK